MTTETREFITGFIIFSIILGIAFAIGKSNEPKMDNGRPIYEYIDYSSSP